MQISCGAQVICLEKEANASAEKKGKVLISCGAQVICLEKEANASAEKKGGGADIM